MQQLNVHSYYGLGKKIEGIEREIAKIDESLPLNEIAWPLFLLRWDLSAIVREPCALLPASQRAAKAIIQEIGDHVTENVEDIFKLGKDDLIYPYQLNSLLTSIKNFETVLKNDMPEMSNFAVAQIGIFRTEDLINRSFLQVEESLRPLLKPLALTDITEAGKCLAFRVPTAAAFHLSRAIETGMNQYYEALTGKPFNLQPRANNWGAKTQALRDATANEKITEFLEHIRKAYRNPVTHPEVVMEPAEAFGFFSQALSVISLMLAAVREAQEKCQPVLPGLTEGLCNAVLDSLGDMSFLAVAQEEISGSTTNDSDEQTPEPGVDA
jgi:hypothetical protein